MRAVIAAAAAVALLSGNAAAEEEKSRHDGFYVGAVGGYSTSAISSAGIDFAGQGAFGGAVLGWGQVVSGTYYGVELDAMLRDIKPKIGDGTTTISMSNDWVGTARVRLGLPVGPALFYSTGGVAVTESKLAVSGLGSDRQYIVGWVAGVGAEAALTKTMSIRVEGLHYGLPDETFRIDGAEAAIKQSETVARVGVTFRLN